MPADITLYPLSWARSVFKRFYGQYARASEIVAHALGISSKEATIWLANNDPKWAQYKAIVHSLHSWAEKSPSLEWNSINCAMFLRMCNRNRMLEHFLPLDSEKLSQIIKEQAFKGGPGADRREATGPTFFGTSFFEGGAGI